MWYAPLTTWASVCPSHRIFLKLWNCYFQSDLLCFLVISNKCPYKQWYSLLIITIPSLCTSDMSKESDKGLWENNHWYLASTNREDKDDKVHRFSNHFSLHIFHPCPKGTLSLVYWQLYIAVSTLENFRKLLDKTYNKNYFKYFKYDWNVQYIRQCYI